MSPVPPFFYINRKEACADTVRRYPMAAVWYRLILKSTRFKQGHLPSRIRRHPVIGSDVSE